MAAPKKSAAKKAFALRLDPAVHAAVERLAGAELRSANAQIEMLLREALEKRGIDVRKSAKPRRGRPPKED
ncbi:toxin-antitoxin system HicB family antitoxin [Parerythrobacter aestuarii]|uniref:toxin-antitoxin system HicB family antitoxin n=1 Tax=Parerythrobacter aestuarii TaxID=3020909 RepID=UPI0024DE4C41|nr:toxin-antitoxin system HicB family antitoxin [Parerythrobacter aestuarii]